MIREKVDSELCWEGQARIYWVKKGGIRRDYSRQSEQHPQGTKCGTLVIFGELYVQLFCREADEKLGIVRLKWRKVRSWKIVNWVRFPQK